MTIACMVAMMGMAADEAQSVNGEGAVSLSLKEAVQHALEHNRSLKNAGLSVKQAEAARWQAIASMLPQAKVGFDYSNMFGYEMELSAFTIPMNPYGTLTAQASVALSGQLILAAIMQKTSVNVKEITEQKSVQTIESDILNSYVSILATEQTIELLEKNYEKLEELQALSQRATDVGVTEQVATDQISVQVSQFSNSINDVKRSREILYNMMRFYLGLPAGTPIVLTDDIDSIISLDTAMQLLSEQFDIKSNYDYRLAEQNLAVSKQQVVLATMAYSPTVSAYYQYSDKTYFGKDAGMDMTPPHVFGASISMPLFTSGKNAAAIHEKKLALEAAENSLADVSDQLYISESQYRYNLTSAIEKYNVQKSNVEVSQRVLDNVSNKYEYGYSSSMEVTQSSQDLLTAQSNYVQTLIDVVSAYVNLKNLLNIEINQ